jgi:hypothetical protein
MVLVPLLMLHMNLLNEWQEGHCSLAAPGEDMALPPPVFFLTGHSALAPPLQEKGKSSDRDWLHLPISLVQMFPIWSINGTSRDSSSSTPPHVTKQGYGAEIPLSGDATGRGLLGTWDQVS